MQASARLQAQLQALGEGNSGSSGERYGAVSDVKSPKVTPAAAKSKGKGKGDKNQQSETGPAAETSEAARQARLRRVCERKPSGKLMVPQEIHDKWRNNVGNDREELLDALEEAGWDKDCIFVLHSIPSEIHIVSNMAL